MTTDAASNGMVRIPRASLAAVVMTLERQAHAGMHTCTHHWKLEKMGCG